MAPAVNDAIITSHKRTHLTDISLDKSTSLEYDGAMLIELLYSIISTNKTAIRLKHALFLPGALCLVSLLGYSQTAPLTTDEAGYFTSFFESIGSADLNPDILSRHEIAAQRLLDMDSADSLLLHSAAQDYRSVMIQLRTSENAIIAKKTGVNEADRAAIAGLIQKRDKEVSRIAATLLRSVRPETAARLLNEAQLTIKLRTAKAGK